MSTVDPDVPHDPWAAHYETVMSLSFGGLYRQMTSQTLAEIDRLVPRDATILDLGAGSGRMALPLAQSGRRVIAVDRSTSMLAALRHRASLLGPEAADRIEVRGGTIDRIPQTDRVDLVLCVFTVLAYCLTEDSLHDTFRGASGVLNPGSPFLLDVPAAELFQSMEIESSEIIRSVSIDEVEPAMYEYREHTLLRTETGSVEYRDAFRLRRWTLDEVREALGASGFGGIEDVTERFADLGARYLVARSETVSPTGG